MVKPRTIAQALTGDDRGVSSTISVVLLVALVVIAASAVGAYLFGIADSGLQDPPPQGAFEFEYDTSTGNMTITYTGGESIEPGNVDVEGQAVTGDYFTEDEHGDEVTAGDSVTLTHVDHGVDYRVTWETEKQTQTLATYTAPQGIDYDVDYSPEGDDGESATAQLEETFTVVSSSPDYYAYSDNDDHVSIRSSGSGGDDEWVTYRTELPDGTDNVTVDLHFVGHEYGGGAHFYAVTESGSKVLIACDGGESIDCGNRGGNYEFDDTYTLRTEENIDYVEFKIDHGGGCCDETALYNLQILIEDEDE